MENMERNNSFFKAALKHLVNSEGHGGKAFIGNKSGVSPALIGQLINPKLKKTSKLETQKKIAKGCGYTYEEFLNLGKNILANNENKIITAKNGSYLGDLLHDIILNPYKEFYPNPEKTFAKKSGISEQELKQILSSAKAPSWETLKKMFCECGININFLLAGDKSEIIGAAPDAWPESYIDRIAIALNLKDDLELASFLNLKFDSIHNLRQENPSLSGELRETLIKNGINPAWIESGKLPSHVSPPESTSNPEFEKGAAEMNESELELKQYLKVQIDELKQEKGQLERKLEEKDKRIKELTDTITNLTHKLGESYLAGKNMKQQRHGQDKDTAANQ